MKVGDKVVIKDNLFEELCDLGVDTKEIKLLAQKYVGTIQIVTYIWTDQHKQLYVTINSDEEIPIQCIETI